MRTTAKEPLRFYPVKAITISPAEVGAASTSAQTFSLPATPGVEGLKPGDLIKVTKPTNQTGVYVADAWVATVNTVTILFANCSAGNITPTAGEVYEVAILGAT